jgi:hypothetical protein
LFFERIIISIKAFSQTSWGRLDMKPNKNKRKPKRGEKKVNKEQVNYDSGTWIADFHVR